MSVKAAKLENTETATRWFAWRRPQSVIALENFDFPHLRQRGPFDAGAIAKLVNSRMAGCAFVRSPAQIRDAIRSGRLDRGDRAFLHDLISQFDCLEIRLFAMACGISRYELAHAMIASDVRLRLLTEWMNCQSPRYNSSDQHHRTWDVDSWP